MGKPFFLDTNILIYTQDLRDLNKQKVADDLVQKALATGEGVISSQVVQEFCNVAATKYKQTMTPQDLKEYLRVTLNKLWRHVPSQDFYYRTIELFGQNSLSFYDALIVQAAIDLGCKTLYSEDMQNGSNYGELRVKNPFLAEKWLKNT